MDEITLPTFEIGNMTFYDFVAARGSKAVDKPSTVGLDVFKNAYLMLDFPNKTLIYLKNRLKTKQTIPFRLYDNRIVIPVKIGRKETNATFDTGASHITFSQDFIDEHKDYFTFIRNLSGNDSTGNNMIVKLYSVKHCSIDTHYFN